MAGLELVLPLVEELTVEIVQHYHKQVTVVAEAEEPLDNTQGHLVDPAEVVEETVTVVDQEIVLLKVPLKVQMVETVNLAEVAVAKLEAVAEP